MINELIMKLEKLSKLEIIFKVPRKEREDVVTLQDRIEKLEAAHKMLD